MDDNRLEQFRGLDLLLEAAEHHSLNLVTPPRHNHRHSKSSRATLTASKDTHEHVAKPTSFASPPKKRSKLNFNDEPWLRPNPRSPPKKFTSIKKSGTCPAGSSHRVWERADECIVAAKSMRHFKSSGTIVSRWPSS